MTDFQKMMLIRNRLKSTEDLWLYMTQLLGIHLPPLKACSLGFLQDILANKKKCLKANQVPMIKVPNWKELALKFIHPQILKMHPDIVDYHQEIKGDPLRYPDKEWYYRNLNGLYPETY